MKRMKRVIFLHQNLTSTITIVQLIGTYLRTHHSVGHGAIHLLNSEYKKILRRREKIQAMITQLLHTPVKGGMRGGG